LVKLLDVRRGRRVALHSPTLEPPKDDPGPGDAKLAGSLVEIEPPADNPDQGTESFKLDITEVEIRIIRGQPAHRVDDAVQHRRVVRGKGSPKAERWLTQPAR